MAPCCCWVYDGSRRGGPGAWPGERIAPSEAFVGVGAAGRPGGGGGGGAAGAGLCFAGLEWLEPLPPPPGAPPALLPLKLPALPCLADSEYLLIVTDVFRRWA